MDSDDHDRAASLKAHKALPRTASVKRNASGVQVSKQVERIERRLSQAQEKAQEKSKDISSWIGESSQILVDPNLPLTPPSLPQDPEEQQLDDKAGDDAIEKVDEVKDVQATPRVHTPVVQRSPPTPDITPPRPGQYPQSGLRPRPTPTPFLRQPSSAAESFKTAQEQLSSEDERATLTSARKGRNNSSGSGNVGLGLGLETSGSSGTPTVRDSSVAPRVRNLDDPWEENANMVSEDPFIASESVAVQEIEAPEKKPRRRRRKIGSTGEKSASTTPDDFQASLDRNMPLRERIHRDQVDSSSSLVDRFAEQIQWPSESDDKSDDIGSIHVDKKRLSELSNQSQVVQALVVSTPPQRRQRLRHSSKNESLRSASSPLNSSNRSSLLSNEPKPRLHHKRGTILDKGNRVSVNSDSGISMGSERRKRTQDALPLPIPQRRSSLKKKRLPHLMTSANANTSTKRDKNRPGTAPDATRQTIEPAPRRPRAASDAVPSAESGDIRGRHWKPTGPAIPPRSSSLSAPTSRNASRTTSLTSTSLHKHNIQQQNLQQQPQTSQNVQTSPVAQDSQESPDSPVDPHGFSPQRKTSTFLSVGTVEKRASDDLSGGKHRSMLTTPFSMASMQSSTPGPYEVNEATAIEIYPHNNTSVLVVQSLPQRGSEQPRLSARLSGNVRINMDSFNIQPRIPNSRRVMDSPLKNPRSPPKPPPVVLVPLTPAEPESAPPSRGRMSTTSSNSRNGPFSMVRRALSARRYSETFASPMRSLTSRSNSLRRSERKTIKADDKKDTSPFWRPRGFWNDLSDDEDEGQRTGFIRTSIRGPGDLGNSSLVRRLGSLRGRRKITAANESDGTYVAYGRPAVAEFTPAGDMDYEPSYRPQYPRYDGSGDSFEGVERRVGLLSRMRNTGHLRPFSSLQEAIKEMRQKRVEEQLERQRERLRKNIGPVILQSDARPFY